jgi:hypothetical protein
MLPLSLERRVAETGAIRKKDFGRLDAWTRQVLAWTIPPDSTGSARDAHKISSVETPEPEPRCIRLIAPDHVLRWTPIRMRQRAGWKAE